jgi:hypothetical protein
VRPEEDLGLVSVVDAAQQAKVLDRRSASSRERDDVVEFQEAPLVTPPASFGHECAAPSVTVPDRALDLGRDMSRAGRRLPARMGMLGRREFLLRQVLEQHRQGPLEDRARIAVGNHVSQQFLREPQLLARLLRDGELDLVAVGRKGRNDL